MSFAVLPNFFEIRVGAEVLQGDKRFRITHLISVDTALGVDLETGDATRLPIESLKLVEAQKQVQETPKDLSLYAADDWAVAQGRMEVVKELLNQPHRTREESQAIADKAGVHVATIYRWLSDYLKAGTVSGLVPSKPGRKSGTRLLSMELEAILDAVIEEFYLKEQRPTPQDVIEEVQARCRLAKIAAPHPNTVRNRLKRVPEVVRLRRRGRREEAIYRFTPIKGAIETATHPFSVVMIDHTPMDIIVVDEVNRQPVGRPYLTLAIDVFSRAVGGLYLSMDPPSAASVGLCLAHAMCSKREYLAALGVPGSWPVWGPIGVVHTDNAREFRGVALERGAQQHGIDLQFRPPATPHYGGHIERLIGTAMRWTHKLPGTTFSNTRERKGYDSEAQSALTLKELEVELVDFIVNQYHQRQHSGIGVPPLKKWERGIIGNDDQPGLGLMPMPEDPQRLLIDFMPMETRTIQRYGVQWDKIHYYDPVLDTYINACDPKTGETKEKFIVRRDPRDISKIHFFDPATNAYTPLPYRNIGHPAVSLFELKEVKRRLAEEGRKDIDENLLFEQIERQRERVAAAVQKSKSARRAQARSHDSAKTVPPPAAQRPALRPSTPRPEGMAGDSPVSLTELHGVEEDIFAEPIRPFDEIGMRR